jgi:hypothetical protein
MTQLNDEVPLGRVVKARPVRRRIAMRPLTGSAALTILDAMADPRVFRKQLRAGPNWLAWRSFLAALFGLPMTAEQLAIFAHCTQRQQPRPGGYREAWLCCGRRALKSFTLALIAVFLACFKDWRSYLGPGEMGTVMVIAQDRRQCRVILRYIRGLIDSCPMLRNVVESETAESITLKSRIVIEIHTSSFRSTRGYSLIAALCDEIAYWPSEDSAEPDREVLAALRPGMSTIPGAMLLCASSPYSRKGALFDAHRRYFAKDSDVLIWQAPTRYMNPSVPQSEIDRAFDQDPQAAAADWMAEFRADRESYINREVVQAAVEFGRYELPPDRRSYVAFVDPSGGSADSFTLAIAYRNETDNKGVLAAVREYIPPFSPDTVCAEMCALLHSYGLNRVTGDNYAKVWPVERFKVHGVTYEPSEKVKSQIYSEFLPLLNSSRVELLDNQRLINQLCSLERHTGPSGRDQINHPPNSHDDLANCVAGALVACTGSLSSLEVWKRFGETPMFGPGETAPNHRAPPVVGSCNTGPGSALALDLQRRRQQAREHADSLRKATKL